ncbi:MAG TPA: P-loop NTPase, partial [Steroidobacteraceae bacterium]|nr:P-loop NTPase [Steroidobacteraceae bacterium]
WGPSRGTIAVLGGAGLAALMRPPGGRASEPRGGGDESPFDLWLRTFGDHGEAARLRELVLAWDSAGRPRSEELQIRAYPRGTNVERSPDDLVLEKRETTLVLDWGVKPAAGDRRPAINAPDFGSPSRRTRRDRSKPKASADGDRGLDADAIRASLESIARSGGQTLLSAVDVADVVVEGNWAAVILAREEFSAESLARVYRHLTSAFPHGGFELRAGARIYRGGAGFGEGRHVVAVLGGKGGVGKFTLAVNLALTLAAMGLPAGLPDADLNAPDLPHLLGIHLTKPLSGPGWRLTASAVTPPSRRPRPQEALGVELMSAGFVVPERFPPVISSRALVSSLLRYFVFEVAWRAQVLLIDAPPGTGEELQAVAGELPLSGAIFVTTPQDLAQMDAERTLTLLTDRGVPVIGVVQNMASLTCPHCAREIDLFAQSPRLAEAGLRPLGSIPFDVQLSAAADGGRPRVLGDPRGPIAYEFARIGAAVRRWLFDRGGIAREPAFGPAS